MLTISSVGGAGDSVFSLHCKICDSWVSGKVREGETPECWRCLLDKHEARLQAAIEVEREACAKIAENRGGPVKQEERREESWERAACHQVAALIRARKA